MLPRTDIVGLSADPCYERPLETLVGDLVDPSWTNTRVLVTGGAGFVGARLVGQLASLGAEVHGVVRARTDLHRLAGLQVALHEACLTELSALRAVVSAVRPDVVFHLAGGGGHAGARGRRATFAANTLTALHLLEALEAHRPRRLVHVGTATAFAPSSGPIAEDHLLAPTTSYAASKAAGTLLMLQAGAEGWPVRVVRPFSVYGPGERPDRLVPTAIRAALTGAPVALTPPGYVRDLVWVDDVCEGLLLAASTEGCDGEIFHLGTGVETSNEKLVAAVERVMGKRLDVAMGAWPLHATDRRSWCADPTKAKALLGWQARTSLAEGLARYVGVLRG